ncbi:unnamed protein product [Agarophyton chilense]
MAKSATTAAMHAVFFAVAFYWSISITMVFVNKTLLSDPEGKLDAPLFITWFQCVVTVLGCYVLGELGIANVPKFELKKDVLRQMLPLSFVFTMMMVCNNLCLKFVEISFYQVARSLTIVFNVVFDFIILGQRTSFPATLCCALVVSGFLVGNQNEMRWSLQGVLFGVAASFFVAMNAIYVKKKFPIVDNNPWKLTLYNNMNAAIIFIPLILCFGEPQVILMSENILKLKFWLMMVTGGVFGICISFAVAAQIKYTSPLTHNVSATAKAAAQTVLGLIVYRNPINVWGAASVAVILVGSLFYTLVRRSEMKKKLAAQDAQSSKVSEDTKPLIADGEEAKETK